MGSNSTRSLSALLLAHWCSACNAQCITWALLTSMSVCPSATFCIVAKLFELGSPNLVSDLEHKSSLTGNDVTSYFRSAVVRHWITKLCTINHYTICFRTIHTMTTLSCFVCAVTRKRFQVHKWISHKLIEIELQNLVWRTNLTPFTFSPEMTSLATDNRQRSIILSFCSNFMCLWMIRMHQWALTQRVRWATSC